MATTATRTTNNNNNNNNNINNKKHNNNNNKQSHSMSPKQISPARWPITVKRLYPLRRYLRAPTFHVPNDEGRYINMAPRRRRILLGRMLFRVHLLVPRLLPKRYNVWELCKLCGRFVKGVEASYNVWKLCIVCGSFVYCVGSVCGGGVMCGSFV